MANKLGYLNNGGKAQLTHFFIAFLIGVFILEVLLQYLYGSEYVERLFFVYGFSLAGVVKGYWWGPITSLFIHASPDHLLLNVLALYFFGRAVESELGKKKFLFIFFVSGVAGDLFMALTTLFSPSSIPTVGASGAIFGLMGAAMIVRPLEMIFYPYLVPIPLFLVAVLYTVYNVAEFAALLITGQQTDIAYAAHLGGAIAGLFFGAREEGMKRSVLIITASLLVLLLIPFFWSFLSYLELTNYVSKFVSR